MKQSERKIILKTTSFFSHVFTFGGEKKRHLKHYPAKTYFPYQIVIQIHKRENNVDRTLKMDHPIEPDVSGAPLDFCTY